MRVLHVVDALAPVGGAETYVRGLTGLLASAGHEVAVLQAGGSEIHPAVVAQNGSSGLGPDVVHVHGPALPPGLEAPRAVPAVHSLHDFGFACASGMKYFRSGRICARSHGMACLPAGIVAGCNHRFDPRPSLVRYREIERELPLLRRAAGLVVHSRFMRSVALANGLPAERVTVIPLFVPPTDGLSTPARRTIAFVGRIVREKGLDVLIEALSSCPDRWDGLLVAGEGWDRERCHRLVHRYGIGSKVEFLGHLDAAGVRGVFDAARVVAVPSRWPEPFGIVGLEAMAAGRPVVASGVGGIPEWLDDGRTGVLVPPGDPRALARALVSVLAEPGRAETMGAEGRRQIERFSPESHLRQLLAVYEQAAGATPVAAPEARAS
jgi:glycosyltransferase involved in cell wall biosynthesis